MGGRLLLLVLGVGHGHWELQHTPGETRSPSGRLPPAGLAHVRLDHVPGVKHWHTWIFGFLDGSFFSQYYILILCCRWRGLARQVRPQQRRAARRRAGQGRRSRSAQRPGRLGRRRIPFLRRTRRSRPTKANQSWTLWSMTERFPQQLLLLDSRLSQSPTGCCLKFTGCLLRATFLLRRFYFYIAPHHISFYTRQKLWRRSFEKLQFAHFYLIFR